MATAKQMFTAARTDLICDQPFFGALALSLTVKEDPTCQTAWVDGRNLGYNPTFIESLSHSELVGLIAHEVMHCAMGHPWRRDNRDGKQWNVACFAEGTPVLMADGSQKAIQHIAIGESVHSPEGPSRVLGVKYSGMERCVRIGYNDSSFLCTGNHPILTTKGLIHAAFTEGYRGLYCRAEGQSNSGAIHSSQLSDDGANRPFQEYEGELRGYSSVPSQAGFIRESIHNQAVQRSCSAYSLRNGLRLLSGYRGRRGNDIGAGSWEVHSSAHSNFQHGILAAAMAQGAGIFRSVGEKFGWESLLPNFVEWMASGQAVALDPALLGHQGGFSGFSLGAYLDSRKSTSERASDGAYAADCLRDSDYQHTRITVSGLSESYRPVYDIVTEKQFIVAAGLVVHNCDYAINGDLQSCGFTLPKDGLFPSAEQKGKSSEWIYARLPQPKDDKGKKGGQGTPQLGAGKPDPAGEVRDAPTGDDENGNPAPTEGEWKQRTAEAAQAAKMQGSLPAGIARMVEVALDKRIDVRSLLLRFMTERTKADYSWAQPNTRYLSQGLYLPALNSISMGEVAIMVDTSGSVNSVTLQYVRGILQDALDEVNPAGMTVYFVDTKIQGTQRMERGEPLVWEPKGGGGTCFLSFFEEMERGDTQPVCIIALSDLYATFPASCSIPTIWLTDGDKTAPFGETINIDQ